MAIDSIGSNASVNYTQLLNNTSNTRKAGGDDSTGAPGSVSGSGKFADAINQTLAQLGVSASGASSGGSGSATDGSSGASDPGTAASSFADNLFAALQGQIGAQAGAQGAAGGDAGSSSAVSGVGAAGASGASGAAAVSGGGGHHHHGGGGGGKVAGGLQNLIQQLSTSSDSVASSSTDSSTVGGSSTASATDAVGSTPATAASGGSALQNSYNALVAANGGSSANAPSLTQFLQTLSQNLQGAPTSGNVVSTKA